MLFHSGDDEISIPEFFKYDSPKNKMKGKLLQKKTEKKNARKEKKIDLGFLPIGPILGHWRDRKSGLSLWG